MNIDLYAIQNIKNGKFLNGTDFSTTPYKQRTSKRHATIFSGKENAFAEFSKRMCGPDYRVVSLTTAEVKR